MFFLHTNSIGGRYLPANTAELSSLDDSLFLHLFQHATDPGAHIRPCSLIPMFFLEPDEFSSILVDSCALLELLVVEGS